MYTVIDGETQSMGTIGTRVFLEEQHVSMTDVGYERLWIHDFACTVDTQLAFKEASAIEELTEIVGRGNIAEKKVFLELFTHITFF